MSGASSADLSVVLKQLSEECREECDVDQIAAALPEDLLEESDLTVSLEDEGEGGEVENLLIHGYKSEIKWSLKDYRPPRYTYVRYRVPSMIREEVLQSNRVRRVISMLCKETGRSKDQLDKEATDILEEMGHEFSMTILRFLGGLIRKVFKQIITDVTVHTEGIKELRRLSSQKPLLLIPTHRSYLDFILVTWLLYSYDIKTPVIAAGQDFMFMKGVGMLLRRCGAYFIRRSFGKDKLYWALFTEYTQTHIINGDAPVEFFIEGTRSRTGKSLQPKFGMLTIALEPFFDARVSDVAICPITLSYEKTVEENLHVREMMGIPKPKESTTGLIKARAILDNNYGRIHVKAGQIISVYEAAVGKVDRKLRAVVPRAIIPSVHPHERTFVNELAYRILLEQQANAVVFPCSVLAAVLLLHIKKKVWSLDLCKAESELMWACDLLIKMGCNLVWDRKQSCMDHVIRMLSPVVYCEEGHVIVHKTPPTAVYLSSSVFKQCNSLISLGRRRNEFMHSLIHVAMLAKILFHPKSKERTLEQYQRLRDIMQYEFVFMPDSAPADFEKATKQLINLDLVKLTDNVYKFVDMEVKDFLVSLIDPFLITYMDSWQFCISYMPRTLQHSQSLKNLCKRIQTYISVLYCEPYLYGESINLNVIENSILVLAKLSLVSLDKGKTQVFCVDPFLFSNTIREFALTIHPMTSKL